MDKKEERIQTTLEPLYSISILVNTGQWYTVYSSSETVRNVWFDSIKVAVPLSASTAIKVGDTFFIPKHVVAFKKGMCLIPQNNKRSTNEAE